MSREGPIPSYRTTVENILIFHVDKTTTASYYVYMQAELNLIDLMERFSTPEKARTYLEAKRWPDGPVCPHCGLVGEAYELKPTVVKAATVVPKLKLCQVTVHVVLAPMVIGSVNAPLHQREEPFHGVGGNHAVILVAHILTGCVIHRAVTR